MRIVLLVAALALVTLQDRTLCRAEACHAALEDPLSACCVTGECGAGFIPEAGHLHGGAHKGGMCACIVEDGCTDLPLRVRSLPAPRGPQPVPAMGSAAPASSGIVDPLCLRGRLIRWILPSPDIPRLTGNLRI